MLTLKPEFQTARVFTPLQKSGRYKGVYGGRGSGKSHFFAQHLVRCAISQPGFRAVCVREIQKTLAESAKKLLEDKIETLGLGKVFEVQKDRILTPGGGSILFQGMQDYNAESIKSLEGVDVAWIEEAQTLSDRSLTLLRPTIRKPGSEIWASWNPRRKADAVDKFLRGEGKPNDAIVVRANWSDNPWFPEVLNDERLHDFDHFPDRYPHVWEGEYATIVSGAYYAKELALARQQGRIGRVTADPLMTVRFYHDLAFSSSDKADAYTMWVCQFVDREIRVLAYYETVGQSLPHHVRWVQNWMRQNDFQHVEHILPHDGSRPDGLGLRYEDHWRKASNEEYGWKVRTIPNQGAGAAMQRVEATRRQFSKIWFNDGPTEPGREALAFYHERWDEKRQIGLGPDHDWSSHGADSFGLMCSDYVERKGERPKKKDYDFDSSSESSGWAW